MPNPILQVDENMLETKLDRLISEKVGQLPDAMLDAEADEITGAAGEEGVPGWPLRAGSDGEVRHRDLESAEVEGRVIRAGGDRTLPQA